MGKLMCITFDCENPVREAIFWGSALDGYLTNADNTRVEPDSPGPFVYFQQVPEPKSGKSRVHLDVTSTDVKGDIFRMQRMGARIVGEKEEGGRKWTVMQDPEGLEFCVIHETA